MRGSRNSLLAVAILIVVAVLAGVLTRSWLWDKPSSSQTKQTVQEQSTQSFAQFVGEWHVHGAQMTIKADRTGVVQWDNGPCLSRLTPPPPTCSGHATLTFVASRIGIIGTYTRVWFTAGDGAEPPSGFDPGSIVAVGDMFELRKVATGLLKERTIRSHLPPLDVEYGNPYWCGAGISESSRHLCGA